MNECVETLNRLGEDFLAFAWPMLWQSSLLIALIFTIDLIFKRRIRAAVRYALWMVVLIKFLLPPSLALPTGAAWWLLRPHPVVEPPLIQNYTVSYGTVSDDFPAPTVPVIVPLAKLSGGAWAFIASVAMSAGLLSWLLFRWLWVAKKARRAATAPAELDCFLEEARQLAGLRRRPRLRLIGEAQSPAVYGLLSPVILLPRTLAAKLSARQLRAVLLHEAAHLRRGDVWMNCAQTLLQIVYWWHPGLWIANARMRRAREEAVDDAVMLALRDGADAYAPTLLEVARFAFRRPLASLALVGILESRSALRQRIERLMDFRPPRKAGITFLSLCGIFAFCAVALPMGQGPATRNSSSKVVGQSAVLIHIKARFLQVPRMFLTSAAANSLPVGMTNGGVLSPTEVKGVLRLLDSEKGTQELAELEVITFGGRQTEIRATITQPIITNFTVEASAGATTPLVKPYGNTFVPQTVQVKTGPIFDVVPDILGDGHTIRLKAEASRVEFLGYSGSKGLMRNVTPNAAKSGTRPLFEITEASMNKTIYDGQTLVLFPKSTTESSYIWDGNVKRRIPMQPGLAKAEETNNVEIVLATATLIDASGKRIFGP